MCVVLRSSHANMNSTRKLEIRQKNSVATNDVCQCSAVNAAHGSAIIRPYCGQYGPFSMPGFLNFRYTMPMYPTSATQPQKEASTKYHRKSQILYAMRASP